SSSPVIQSESFALSPAELHLHERLEFRIVIPPVAPRLYVMRKDENVASAPVMIKSNFRVKGVEALGVERRVDISARIDHVSMAQRRACLVSAKRNEFSRFVIFVRFRLAIL